MSRVFSLFGTELKVHVQAEGFWNETGSLFYLEMKEDGPELGTLLS